MKEVKWGVSVRTSEAGNVPVVKVAGDFTRRTSAVVGQYIRNLLTRGHRDVALDLSRVRSLDAKGTATLVRAFEDRRRARGRLEIVSASEPVQRHLESCQLEFLFHRATH